MMGHIFYDILLYTITNFKSETCRSSQNGKNYSKMRMIRSTNVIFKYGTFYTRICSGCNYWHQVRV